MNQVFVASFLLMARMTGCLIGAQCPPQTLNGALESLCSQLEVFQQQLDAVKLRAGCSDEFVCSQDREEPLGMEDGRIPDDHITASSFWSAYFVPSRARPFVEEGAKAWAAGDGDSSPWIQVHFDVKVHITGVITLGRADGNEWVTGYKVMYSEDGLNWEPVAGADGTPIGFAGNTDRNTRVVARFPAALHTRFLRILPTARHGHFSMRFEVIGCYESV